ncbi:biopolymer transporter ExbD [Sulfitobacter sp. F26204]|uniref:biopolymer transporter ExbD n=1 Tax=Sulfitobacter sp. F26204 TaxID=2996014 RepID=UPI00225E33FD|nr:biopolymer transporter ExbD [Sulfitobacter sp. F26204]MCX7559540.1 biopolymer transporter ExbD [Sulfitobacter sp. F26204]
MTSLIDVIFLLLLFFMLSSTFSKFAEVELAGPAGQGGGEAGDTLFVQVSAQALRLNTASLRIEELPARLRESAEDGAAHVLLSLSDNVTAQRLTEVLVVLRRLPALKLSILAPR